MPQRGQCGGWRVSPPGCSVRRWGWPCAAPLWAHCTWRSRPDPAETEWHCMHQGRACFGCSAQCHKFPTAQRGARQFCTSPQQSLTATLASNPNPNPLNSPTLRLTPIWTSTSANRSLYCPSSERNTPSFDMGPVRRAHIAGDTSRHG